MSSQGIKMKKNKKETLSERLEKDENAWLKLLSSMGDFAKYLKKVADKEKLDEKRIKKLEDRVEILEDEIRYK